MALTVWPIAAQPDFIHAQQELHENDLAQRTLDNTSEARRAAGIRWFTLQVDRAIARSLIASRCQVKCIHCLGLLSLLMTLGRSAPALAWEDDVHYGLSKWILVQVGFSDSDADEIARANQRTDQGVTDPLLLGCRICKYNDQDSSTQL
jgi:hypothetical protein